MTAMDAGTGDSLDEGSLAFCWLGITGGGTVRFKMVGSLLGPPTVGMAPTGPEGGLVEIVLNPGKPAPDS